MTKIRVATWNLRWAKPNSERGQACIARLRAIDADIICLTEAFVDSLESFDGYSASSHMDTGYTIHAGRRKVLIWSRWPLEGVDKLGSEEMPTGRFVSATTRTPLAIDIVGVCIPWKDAHVNSGRRDRRQWDDHRRYLSALTEINRFTDVTTPAIVLGDFNQRQSGKYARKDVHQLLRKTFNSFVIPTGDLQDTDGKAAIDHIAVSGDAKVVNTGVLSKFKAGHRDLSDHFGVWCDLEIS